MYDSKLRDQMIICKASKPSFTVSFKSILSFVSIWFLWGLTFYLIAKDLSFLLVHPVVHHWTLSEILEATLAFTLLLAVTLQIWDLCICPITKRRRQYRSGHKRYSGFK